MKAIFTIISIFLLSSVSSADDGFYDTLQNEANSSGHYSDRGSYRDYHRSRNQCDCSFSEGAVKRMWGLETLYRGKPSRRSLYRKMTSERANSGMEAINGVMAQFNNGNSCGKSGMIANRSYVKVVEYRGKCKAILYAFCEDSRPCYDCGEQGSYTRNNYSSYQKTSYSNNYSYKKTYQKKRYRKKYRAKKRYTSYGCDYGCGSRYKSDYYNTGYGLGSTVHGAVKGTLNFFGGVLSGLFRGGDSYDYGYSQRRYSYKKSYRKYRPRYSKVVRKKYRRTYNYGYSSMY